MEGRAAALGAGTVLNALSTGTGSAFAIDVETRATVELDPDRDTVDGEIDGVPDGDTELIERCVTATTERWGNGEGGTVRTESDVPLAAGLKSSSAAANATVLATCAALGLTVGGPSAEQAPAVDPETEGLRNGVTDANADADVSRLAACRLGVNAARAAGVTATGAFDDASASMLGGVTVTDNTEDELLAREIVRWDVVVWTPPERAYSADADVSRCRNVTRMANLVAELAMTGRYTEAMSLNGLAFSAALDFPTEPAVEAMPYASGVSLSGTGPSVVAVADPDDPETDLDRIRRLWAERPGTVRSVKTRTDGATILSD